MPTLLQIDSCLNMLSTGRITESIGKLAIARGWNVYIIHGARYVKEGTCMHNIQAESKLGEYWHYVESLLLDRHGLSSRRATSIIVKRIKEINPDLIQLHCIHGYYLNNKVLFNYLNNKFKGKVIWTLHDCWTFTGHCSHFDYIKCDKWKKECNNCPQKRVYPYSWFFDTSYKEYKDKKILYLAPSHEIIEQIKKYIIKFIHGKKGTLGKSDQSIIKEIFPNLAEFV